MIVSRALSSVAAALVVFAGLASLAFAGKSDDTVRFAFHTTLESGDPYFNSSAIAGVVADHAWDTLVYRNPATGEYAGNLATAWRWVDDRTLELDLREGVRFHNGEPFDADDVVYSFDFLANRDNRTVYLSLTRWVDHAEKVGSHRVRVVTKEPFPAAIAYLANSLFVMQPNEYHTAVGPEGMSERPIGTGPYRVTAYAPGKHVRMERNSDYFVGGPKQRATIARVEIRFIPDAQTRVAEVVAGGVDLIMRVSLDQAEQLRSEPQLQVLEGESPNFGFLQLNTRPGSSAAPLRDLRVRQAIMHAIDREALVRHLVGGSARVIHAPCYPAHFGCTESGVPRYEYDPVRARQLLEEAGLSGGFDIDLFDSDRRNETEAIVNYLRVIGIRARPQVRQYAAIRSAARANRVPLWLNLWTTVTADVSNSVSTFFSGSADDLNRDPEVAELLRRGDSAMVPAAREAAYAEALRLIAERAYALPLFTMPERYVAARELVFTPPADGRPRFYEMAWR